MRIREKTLSQISFLNSSPSSNLTVSLGTTTITRSRVHGARKLIVPLEKIETVHDICKSSNFVLDQHCSILLAEFHMSVTKEPSDLNIEVTMEGPLCSSLILSFRPKFSGQPLIPVVTFESHLACTLSIPNLTPLKFKIPEPEGNPESRKTDWGRTLMMASKARTIYQGGL